jgi:hypothetical protein
MQFQFSPQQKENTEPVTRAHQAPELPVPFYKSLWLLQREGERGRERSDVLWLSVLGCQCYLGHRSDAMGPRISKARPVLH